MRAARLSSLDLAFITGCVTDALLEGLSTGCSQLESLSLSYSNLTGMGFKELASCSQLSSLNLAGCS